MQDGVTNSACAAGNSEMNLFDDNDDDDDGKTLDIVHACACEATRRLFQSCQ